MLAFASYVGLRFHESLARANPLFFHDSPQTLPNREKLHVNAVPELIFVSDSSDIVGPNTARDAHEAQPSRVFISGAMINPKGGNETKNEWVSIINLSANTVNLDGWILRDTKHRERLLQGGVNLHPGEAVPIKPLLPMRLANSSGAITLLNANKEIVHRVHYQNAEDGVPNIFSMLA